MSSLRDAGSSPRRGLRERSNVEERRSHPRPGDEDESRRVPKGTSKHHMIRRKLGVDTGKCRHIRPHRS